jgi:DNA-binding beta-propeller fold protein YncE
VRDLVLAPQRATTGQPPSEGPRLYISTTRRLAAIDLASERVIWEQDYGGHCCERMAVSPDGRTIYAPAFGRPIWYVIEAETGALLSMITVVGWPRSTAYAHDDNLAVFAAWESRELLVVDATSNTVIREVGPFTGYVCPFVLSRKAMMAFANVDGLVGFEVGDLLTGLVIERVQIDDYAPEQLEAYECPSHGIAFAPDDKELWVADGVGNRLRVFDAKPLPPVHVISIQLDRQPRWIMFGHDGRYAYSSTGDVVDAASKQIVATLKDESGRIVESERMVDVSMDSPPVGWSR